MSGYQVYRVLPSRAAIIRAVLCEFAVGDHVNAALVNDGDAAQSLGHLHDGLGIGVDLWGYLAPLEDGVHEPRELHGVGREDGPLVALDHRGVVGEVPEAVRVYHEGNLGRLALVNHNGNSPQHRLVPTQPGS